MHWNLRMVAAQRGIWRASDLRRRLAEAGLAISAAKMSYLWSGQPISVRLDDLEVICQLLDCEPSELLVRDQPAQARLAEVATELAASPPAPTSIRPAGRRGGRTLPPV